MATVHKPFTCPNGHHWQVPVAGPLAVAVECICCPECGAAAETAPPAGGVPAETIPPGVSASVGDAGAAQGGPGAKAAAVAEVPAALADHPRYRVLAPLGAGGMGAVFKAEHRLMERQVALKVIREDLLHHPGARERFQREARAAARRAHHHIVLA